MQNAEWIKIKEVFNQTLDLPFGERESFLQNHDDFIQREVRNLLESDEQADEFIATPAAVEFGISNDLNIGQVIDEYQVIGLIGEGGMGNVYLAENIKFSQKVALKLIKRGMDTRAVLKRFKLERQILSRLNHPNIAKLLGGGETADGLPYFVMEYIAGETITKFCEYHQFNVTERLELFQKVCDAVGYAHKNLIIHRDIKPSNIIVTEDGTPKLLDFGIAKLLDNESEKTLTIGRMFTPDYASPEQINGLPITTATDVYSLGVVLYELLSGVRPFNTKSKSYGEIANLILTQEPVRPSSVVISHSISVFDNKHTSENKDQMTKDEGRKTKFRNLKGDLDNIILKALSKDSENRYQTVNDFSLDISRHLNGLPVTATADSFGYRFKKFVVRNRLGTAVASAFLLLLSFAGYQGFVAMRERDKANQRFEKLRETAKSLMNDTRDSLFNIPGTSKVRSNLATKSVELLDSIYDETSTDTEFLNDLAASYEKLGNSYLWELRDFENAIKAGEKGVAIRRRILELEPYNIKRKGELAGAICNVSEAYFAKGDNEATIKNSNEVTSFLRELAEKEPTNPRLESLANHLIGNAEHLKNWEMPAEAERKLDEGNEILQRLIDSYNDRELTPQDQTKLAWNLMWQGGIYKAKFENDKAIANFSRAAELAENAYKSDSSIQLAFNHTSRTHRDLGELYERKGDHKRAFEMYKFSHDWLNNGAYQTQERKSQIIFGISFYAVRCALMLNKLGRQNEADELIKNPIEDYFAIVDLEENAASLVFSPELFSDLAKYYEQTNRLEKGVEIWQKHYERVQKFIEKNPDDIGFLHFQVTALNQIGELYSGYDETSKSFKINDKERLQKAKTYYQKAAELYRKSMTLYTLSQAEKDNLAKIEEKIKELS